MKFQNFSQDEKMKGRERRKENRERKEGEREGKEEGKREESCRYERYSAVLVIKDSR